MSTGEIITRALKNLGFYVVAEREYPSVIKGGHACFNINISDRPIRALREKVDVLMSVDLLSLQVYFDHLEDGGILVHGNERVIGMKELEGKIAERGTKVVNLPARTIALDEGGNVLMVNVVLIGMLWKAIGLKYEDIEREVTEKFKDKPRLLAIDLKCLKAGYEKASKIVDLEIPGKVPETIMMDGNKAISLGAIHCGVRAYYAYPMSPASSILNHMAHYAGKTGMLVKQVEDEISVVNMALGSMLMGTRALAATSGGGYDLMTETVSLAGIIECPLVIVVAQRPGPGTGMPTWTCQSDLNLAIYSSHGEFPRCVIACSDPDSCFDLMQHAFNIAEKFQSPVIVLTEKGIAETNWTIPMFQQRVIPIERGLVAGAELESLVNEDRYRITENGLSKRWLPGTSDAYCFANSDEHLEDGSLTEEAVESAAMISKRLRKGTLIEAALPEPDVFGVESGADISFAGWGSTKNVMLDIIEEYAERGVKVNFLHYSYVWPLKRERALKFFAENKRVFLIEGNHGGQFGKLLEAELGVKFADRLLKYDGRSFFLNDVEKFIDAHNSST